MEGAVAVNTVDAESALTEDALAGLVELDRAVDSAEGEGIQARWEFGRGLLARRVGKKLPKGVLAQLVAETGKSRAELKFRVQFAEQYPSEEALANALANYGSWHEIIRRGFRGERQPPASIEPPEGSYRAIVIDPPWPMPKLEREVLFSPKPPTLRT